MAYAGRIRKVLVAIAETSPTTSRMILDRYLPLVMRVNLDGSEFPVKCHPHRLNRERSSGPNGRFNLLCFHIGNTMMAYREFCLTGDTRILERRMKHLECFKNPDAYAASTIEGNLLEGNYLATPAAKQHIRWLEEALADVQPEKKG